MLAAVTFGMGYGYFLYLYTGWQLRDAVIEFANSVSASWFERVYDSAANGHKAYRYMNKSKVKQMDYLLAFQDFDGYTAVKAVRRSARCGFIQITIFLVKQSPLLLLMWLLFNPVFGYFIAGCVGVYGYWMVIVFGSQLNPHLRLTHICNNITRLAFVYAYGEDKGEKLLKLPKPLK